MLNLIWKRIYLCWLILVKDVYAFLQADLWITQQLLMNLLEKTERGRGVPYISLYRQDFIEKEVYWLFGNILYSVL